MARKKISIFGAGRVGTTTCQLTAYKELGDIVLWNRSEKKAQGLALDLSESAPIEGFDVNILGTDDFKDTKNSDVIVITAGAQRKEGMSRDDLLAKNSQIVKLIVKKSIKYSPKAIYIIVTNPLDVNAYVAMKAGKIPRERVIGMAGILDSSRFATFIAKELKVSVKDVNTQVLGSHGDSMVPLPGYTDVNAEIKKIITHTINAGAEIISLEESSAYYAPASAIVSMIQSILKDERRIFSCATYLNGEYGLRGIFLGVPIKLGAKGVEKIIELDLDKKESKMLQESAKKVKNMIKKLKV